MYIIIIIIIIMCIFAVSTGAKGFADPDPAWNGGVFSKQT